MIVPRQNETNVLEDLTDEIRRGLTVYFVTEVDEVLALALTPTQKAARAGKDEDGPSKKLSLV